MPPLRVMPLSGSPAGRLAWWLVAVVTAAAGGRIAAAVVEAGGAGGRLPLWDPAKYGAAGVRIADALRGGDVVGFAGAVNELALWPPLFPLLEAPAFLAFGSGFRVAEGLVAALFAVAPLAALWCGGELARPPRDAPSGADRIAAACGLVAGGLAAALLLAAPIVHAFAGLVMLEVPGALLLLLAIGLYARAAATGRPAAWRLAALAATALFFLKYNYGLLWLVPLALAVAADAAGGLRPAARRAVRRLAAVDPRRPWTWFVALYGLLLAAIAVTGGVELRIAGTTLEASSLGNPVYALYLIVLIRWLAWPRRRRRLAEGLRALGPRGRAFALWTALPIALWMLVPDHTKDFFRFVENRAAGPPAWSVEGVLFYPRAFVDLYSPHPAVGVAVLLAAALPFARFRRLPPGRKALALALAVAAVATVLHPYKLPRFLFPVAVPLWLSAAAAVADGLAALARRAGARRGAADHAATGGAVEVHGGAGGALGLAGAGGEQGPSAGPGVVALALAAIVACGTVAAAGLRGIDRPRVAAARAEYSVPPEVAEPLDAVAEFAAGADRSVLLGYWNGFSPALVEWRMRQLARAAGGRLDGDRLPAQPERLARSRDAARVLDRAAALAGGGTVRVLSLEGFPGPPAAAGLAAETAWLDPARAALPSDPRFTLETERNFPAAGYRLRVYRVAGGLVPAGEAAATGNTR